MRIVRFRIADSLDGFIAAPDQTEENPLPPGGCDRTNRCSSARMWRRIDIRSLEFVVRRT